MTRQRSLLVAVGITTIGFLLGGCTALGRDGQIETSAIPETSEINEPEVYPLQEFESLLRSTNLSPEEQSRRLNEQHLRREELIAQCMRDAGFEYIPQPSTLVIDENPTANPQDLNDREWVSQWGYGVIEAVKSLPSATNQVVEDQPITDDPNAIYWAGLSPAEQEAFMIALFGDQARSEIIEMDENGELPEGFWETADLGCFENADQIVRAENPDPGELLNSSQFEPLAIAWGGLYDTISRSAEMAQTHADWAACMAGRGIPNLERQEDGLNTFLDELNVVRQSLEQSGIDPATSPQVQALTDREIEIALADLDCRESTNFTARQEQVRIDYETQFINDHRTELEALRSAIEQGN